MQSADFRNSYDSSQSLPLYRTRFRRILCQRQMSPGIQIVTEISFENPSQMRLSEHDDVVEAFLANTSNQTFGKRILPRTPWSSEHFRDSHALNSVSEVAAVNSVPITDQIAGCRVFWKCFDDLLCGPFCRGMLRDIEMQHAATLMRQHNEYE